MANTNNNWGNGNAPQESTTAGPNPRQGWGNGNAPQESTTAGPNPRQGWESGNAPQESTTAGPNPRQGWGNGNAPQESNTGAPNRPSGQGKAPEYSFYIIDGVTYRVVRVISTQSGEAKIFEVESGGRHFALKLYHAGVSPNHAVLEAVSKLNGNGLLVDIYAHGTWRDDVTRLSHDYEVMAYCAGGSLATLRLEGNEARLKEIAVRLASALDFAHKHGVLHRDVKPANFLWVDKEQTRFVLTDWGLAKTLDAQGHAVTDAGRTKIYAAPEMYTYIPGTPTYVGPKADFFSMGMTLLALWMGEGLLIADERKLVKDKQEERLPYPARTEMSEHTLSLLKALTRRDPDARAGFDDIVRWAKGEIIFDDPARTAADKAASAAESSNFKIVFSASDKLIAHSPAELASIMWANQSLAISYLYSDKVKQWFSDLGYPELAVAMEQITEMRYPANREAGLYAACLTLDPTMGYPLPTTSGEEVLIDSTDELADGLASGQFDLNIINSLTSNDAFLTWVATRNAPLAGRALAERKRKGATVWSIFYRLFPDRGLDFLPLDRSKLATPPQLGQRILSELSGAIRPKLKANILYESLNRQFPSSRLFGYLHSKENYQKQIDWISYCLDFDSADNKKKYGPYTLRIARLKAAQGLTGEGKGYITVLADKLYTLDDLRRIYPDGCDALSKEWQEYIADWLATQFQENPYADLKKKSYKELTVEYAYFLPDWVPECGYVERQNAAMTPILRAIKYRDKAIDSMKRLRLASLLLLIPMVLLCAWSIWWFSQVGFTFQLSKQVAIIGGYCGIGLAVICFFRMWWRYDYGFLISAGVAALLSFAVKVFIIYGVHFLPLVSVIVFPLITLYFAFHILLAKPEPEKDRYTEFEWEEMIDRLAVGSSFGTTDKLLPRGLPDDYPACIMTENRDEILEEVKLMKSHLVWLTAITIVAAGIFFGGRYLNNRYADAEPDAVVEQTEQASDNPTTKTPH